MKDELLCAITPSGGGEKGTNYSGGPPPAYSWPPSQPAAPYPAAPTATVVTQTPVIVQQQVPSLMTSLHSFL